MLRAPIYTVNQSVTVSEPAVQAVVAAGRNLSGDASTGTAAITAECRVTDNDSAASAAELAEMRECVTMQRRQIAIQRASAEQALRVVEQIRACHEALLEHLAQPCFVLDRDLKIVRWNIAMSRWTQAPKSAAEGKDLQAVTDPDTVALISRTLFAMIAQTDKRAAAKIQCPAKFAPDALASSLTLLPQHRIHGYVEAVIVLVEPKSTD